MSRKSSRKSKKSSIKSKSKYRKPKNMSCKQYLSAKIKINSREFKNKKQAIAVSYAEVKKGNPACKRWL